MGGRQDWPQWTRKLVSPGKSWTCPIQTSVSPACAAKTPLPSRSMMSNHWLSWRGHRYSAGAHSSQWQTPKAKQVLRTAPRVLCSDCGSQDRVQPGGGRSVKPETASHWPEAPSVCPSPSAALCWDWVSYSEMVSCSKQDFTAPITKLNYRRGAVVAELLRAQKRANAGSRCRRSPPWWGHEEKTWHARPFRIQETLQVGLGLYPTLYPPPSSVVVLVCPAADSYVAWRELSCSSFTE